MEIDPLLVKLEALAPQFGRAHDDILAMVSRGRSGDFKGVMQNARLVLETLLRAMVATELKQTPGKAMLDELITKFRQQANQGVVPTNVLAHMGTVQAWGNLSSHDHAAGLDAEAVKVGPDEVLASLNSMVAILSWYSGRYGAPTPAPALATPFGGTAPAAAAPLGRRAPVAVIALAALAAVGGAGAWFATRPKEVQAPLPAGPSAFATLDAVYARRTEPAPPEACRLASEAPLLAPAADDAGQLKLLQLESPEAHYLLARALYDKRQPASEALAPALGCVGFAAAQSLAGKIAVSESRLADAEKNFQLALAASPQFQNARYNLGAVYLKQQKKELGAAALEQVVKAEPKRAEAHLLLGIAYESLGDAAKAKAEFCQADQLGETEAHERCVR